MSFALDDHCHGFDTVLVAESYFKEKLFKGGTLSLDGSAPFGFVGESLCFISCFPASGGSCVMDAGGVFGGAGCFIGSEWLDCFGVGASSDSVDAFI